MEETRHQIWIFLILMLLFVITFRICASWDYYSSTQAAHTRALETYYAKYDSLLIELRRFNAQ